jgi:hypothetical protein
MLLRVARRVSLSILFTFQGKIILVARRRTSQSFEFLDEEFP